jgi:hypothetical protein
MRSAATLWRSASTWVIATGHVNAGVPEHGTGGGEINISDQEGRRGGLADRVQAKFRHTSHTTKPLEIADVITRIDRLSEIGGRNPVAVDPHWCGQPLGRLSGPVGTQLSGKRIGWGRCADLRRTWVPTSGAHPRSEQGIQ